MMGLQHVKSDWENCSILWTLKDSNGHAGCNSDHRRRPTHRSWTLSARGSLKVLFALPGAYAYADFL